MTNGSVVMTMGTAVLPTQSNKYSVSCLIIIADIDILVSMIIEFDFYR